MGGLGINAGLFLGSAGQAFTQAYTKSAELKLHQDQEMRARQRELHEQADKNIAEGWKTINQTIMAGQAAGHSGQQIAADPGFGKFVSSLRQHVKASGRDVGMFDFTLSQALSGPSAYDIANGSPERQAQNQRQQQYEKAPLDWDQGTAPASFVQAGDQGQGQGQATGAGTLPPVPGPQQPQQQQYAPEHADFQQEIEGLTRAMSIAPTAGAKEAFAIRLREVVHEKLTSGTDHIETKEIKDEDGNVQHFVFINKRTRQVLDENGHAWAPVTGHENDDAKNIAEAIESGKQPPSFTNLGRKGTAKKIRGILARDGFDLSRAQQEWDIAHKQIASLNGPQQERYTQLSGTVVKTIDRVRELSRQMQNSGVPALNALKLKTYIQAEGNSANGQLAARYIGAVNTLKEEFANLANGGYAPTDAAWALANQQINADYGVEELDAAISEVQRLINYRMQQTPHVGELGPNSPNRYTTGQGQAPAPGQSEMQPNASGGAAPPPTAPAAGAVAPAPGLSGEAGGIKWREVK